MFSPKSKKKINFIPHLNKIIITVIHLEKRKIHIHSYLMQKRLKQLLWPLTRKQPCPVQCWLPHRSPPGHVHWRSGPVEETDHRRTLPGEQRKKRLQKTSNWPHQIHSDVSTHLLYHLPHYAGSVPWSRNEVDATEIQSQAGNNVFVTKKGPHEDTVQTRKGILLWEETKSSPMCRQILPTNFPLASWVTRRLQSQCPPLNSSRPSLDTTNTLVLISTPGEKGPLKKRWVLKHNSEFSQFKSSLLGFHCRYLHAVIKP